MTDKALIGIGAAVVVLPLGAFFYFGGLGPLSTAVNSEPAVTANSKAPAGTAPLASTQAAPSVSTTLKPADPKDLPKSVTPAVLENLAQSVQLDGNESPSNGTKKPLWEKTLPIAQALVEHSDADCEEHNWLVRFVECGQQALSNSPDYYSSANALASMPRNAQEAQTGEPSN